MKARAILAEYAASQRSMADEKKRAVETFVARFVTSTCLGTPHGPPGWTHHHDPVRGELTVTFEQHWMVQCRTTSAGDFVYVSAPVGAEATAEARHVPHLVFHALTGELETHERDATIAPTPGKPYPTKGRFVVFAEFLVAAIEDARRAGKRSADDHADPATS